MMDPEETVRRAVELAQQAVDRVYPEGPSITLLSGLMFAEAVINTCLEYQPGNPEMAHLQAELQKIILLTILAVKRNHAEEQSLKN